MDIQLESNLVPDTAESGRSYRALLFALCFLSSGLGGTVSTLISVYLPVVLKDLQSASTISELDAIRGYINAIFIFGWALGGFVWGVTSDKIGRKKAFVISVLFYGTFTILTGFANNWWFVVICRFLSGFGVGGVAVVNFTLLSEVWPNRSKAIYMGILSVAFPIGIFSAGLINYLISSWREGFLIGIIPVIISLTGIWFIRESEKWLSNKHSEANSKSALSRLFSGDHNKELIIGSLTFGTMQIGLWAIFSWLPTWIQTLVATDGQHERGLSMMFLGMGGIIGGFASGWISNKLGIRKAMIICFAACSLISFILFKTNSTISSIVYTEIIVLALFFGASQGVLSVYIPHIFPTYVRSSATGVCFNVGRVFTAISVLMVSVLVTGLGGFGNAIFIFSLVFIVGLLVVIFMKEGRRYD
jgi:MFS family permease